jgi:hypothetical protein
MAPSLLIALLVTGAAQALGALPDLFGSVNGGMMASSAAHLTREAAASEIALAAGFVYVAAKPFAASAVRLIASVLTALVIFSSLSSTGGLIGVSGGTGSGEWPLEAHHLIALFGTALLWLLPEGTQPRFSSQAFRSNGLTGRRLSR